MRELPRRSGLRPDRTAAGISNGLEFRLDTPSQPKSQELRLRRQQLARHLHQLGGRATAEFIAEMAERFGPYVDDRLAAYVRRLNPEILRAAGGDGFPRAPIRVVGRDR
jgi:hypothetical protein